MTVALVVLSSCGREIPKVALSDVAKFAGNYKGVGTINGCQCADVFTLHTNSDSSCLYMSDCAFGEGSCVITRTFFGTVRNDTLFFGWERITDKCGNSYNYHSFCTYAADTLICSFSAVGPTRRHCGVKLKRL